MKKVNEELEAKGLKLTRLEEQHGKNYNMLQGNDYIQKLPSPKTLFEIAKILDVDVADLLVEQKKKSKWINQ